MFEFVLIIKCKYNFLMVVCLDVEVIEYLCCFLCIGIFDIFEKFFIYIVVKFVKKIGDY